MHLSGTNQGVFRRACIYQIKNIAKQKKVHYSKDNSWLYSDSWDIYIAIFQGHNIWKHHWSQYPQHLRCLHQWEPDKTCDQVFEKCQYLQEDIEHNRMMWKKNCGLMLFAILRVWLCICTKNHKDMFQDFQEMPIGTLPDGFSKILPPKKNMGTRFGVSSRNTLTTFHHRQASLILSSMARSRHSQEAWFCLFRDCWRW